MLEETREYCFVQQVHPFDLIRMGVRVLDHSTPHFQTRLVLLSPFPCTVLISQGVRAGTAERFPEEAIGVWDLFASVPGDEPERNVLYRVFAVMGVNSPRQQVAPRSGVMLLEKAN